MSNNLFIITAAGGNATAIQVLDTALDSGQYAKLGKKLMVDTAKDGVEQCGFLIPADNHFEMSGGEFCGNAARAAAILLYGINAQTEFEFSMSGFPHKVQATIHDEGGKKYQVECSFPGMQVDTMSVQADGQEATLVDLGGIVHVVIEADFPAEDYQAKHRQITRDLQLTERGAVGVCWISRSSDQITMHPVVWVRDIDSFFYEGSCGSGTIAVGKTTGATSVIQPSDKSINVKFTDGSVILQSEMEVTHEYERH